MEQFLWIIRKGRSEFFSGADTNKVWDCVLRTLEDNLRCSNGDIKNTFRVVYDSSLLLIRERIDNHLSYRCGCSSRNCCKAALRFGDSELITYTRKRYISPRKNKRRIITAERKIALLWIDAEVLRMFSPVTEQRYIVTGYYISTDNILFSYYDLLFIKRINGRLAIMCGPKSI